MSWEIEKVPELKGYTLEWAEPKKYYLSKRNEIYFTDNLKNKPNKVASIDAPLWKKVISYIRPAQRLLRFSVTNVIPLDNNDLFITFDKSVGIINNGKYKTIEGLKRPCRVLRSACALDKSNNIYFGEYLANSDRGEMNVYSYKQGSDTLETVYTFPAGSIKHIHGLYFDKISNNIYCLTGDDENECKIMRSYDNCNTFEIVGEGDETWRAVSILFDKDNLIYGTDAEFRENHIYKIDRKNNERKKIGEVNGTVFYSKRLGEDCFFTTTAENAPSQKENVAAIWHLDKNNELTELASFKKDFWHPTLFQFGTIHFPNIKDIDSELYFYLVGVKGDQLTYRIIKK